MAVFSSFIGGRKLRLLAMLALSVAVWPAAADAGLVQVDISHYVQSTGNAAANYFNGKLLTEHDLAGDQSYKRSGDRYIGETEADLSTLFDPGGFADVSLFFDEADALFSKRTDVKDSHDRFADDFILLNPEDGTWRGRLFLEEFGDILPGVYDDLSGIFRGLVTVPEPAPLAAFGLGLALLAAGRRRIKRAALI